MDKVRFGIMSTARIGLEKVIPAMQSSDLCDIVAISSRSEERAQAAAERLGIETAYGTYEELLTAEDIDAVYNPLPNDGHVSWSIRALEAGKHVLCEKPIGMDAEDAVRLLAAAREQPHLKVMEAFMYRFHPQWERVRKLIADGTIGRPTSVQATFTYFNDDPENIRNRPEHGGGALMDIGCYGISVARHVFGREPEAVSALMDVDPAFGVDRLTSGLLDFGDAQAVFTCATQQAPRRCVEIAGPKGRLIVREPFVPGPDETCVIEMHRGGDARSIRIEPADQYRLQGDGFALSILNDTVVPTPLNDAVANMRVIDAVRESARTGSRVPLSGLR